MSDKDVILGYKKITGENLAVPDITRAFAKDVEQWIDWFSEVKIEGQVPEPLRKMFEVSRGAMISAWFYYPLLTLGAEHCLRLVEAAARMRVDLLQVSNPKNGPTKYSKLIETLAKNGVIADGEIDRWDVARKLRNATAHPENQWIMNPGEAHSFLRISAEQIHSIFPKELRL